MSEAAVNVVELKPVVSLDDLEKEALESLARIKELRKQGSEELKKLKDQAAEITVVSTDALKARDEAGQAKSQAEALAAEVTATKLTTADMKDQVKALLAEAATANKGVAEALSDAKTSQEQLAGLAKRASETNSILKKHDADLEQSNTLMLELTKKIESLLPGATTAGLSSAFQNRKNAIRKTRWVWFSILIGTLTFLAIFTLVRPPAIPTDAGIKGALEELALFLLRRMPVAFPLIWIAIYAGRQYQYHQRLEEDYAHKETFSQSFEGFRRQMENVSGELASESPIKELCEKMLATLSQHPGRIYNEKAQDATPIQAVAEAGATLVESARPNGKK